MSYRWNPGSRLHVPSVSTSPHACQDKSGQIAKRQTQTRCFIHADDHEVSFFVRHAQLLGQNAPDKSLKRNLKAEINKEAWASLNSAASRPFEKPKGGRIAVKVINHLGDEVMKVFRV